MTIHLTSDIPINSFPGRYPLVEKKVIEKQIEEWLKEKIVRVSSSDYSSPVVLVKKKRWI